MLTGGNAVDNKKKQKKNMTLSAYILFLSWKPLDSLLCHIALPQEHRKWWLKLVFTLLLM